MCEIQKQHNNNLSRISLSLNSIFRYPHYAYLKTLPSPACRPRQPSEFLHQNHYPAQLAYIVLIVEKVHVHNLRNSTNDDTMLRIIIGFVVIFVFAQDIAICDTGKKANTQSSSRTHMLGTRTSSLQEGDIFQGVADLLDSRHTPARLTLYIKKATKLAAIDDEFDIEAIAVMNTNIARITYGLKGIYVPSWRQLNLYEVQSHQPIRIVSTKTTKRPVNFEAVGLAGKLTEDNQTIHCQIAYNGNASLKRLDKSVAVTIQERLALNIEN